MEFGKCVASAFQFVLDGLKTPNKRLITALTLLALDDIEYCKYIVEVIYQQVFKVRILFSFFQQKKNCSFVQIFNPFKMRTRLTTFFIFIFNRLTKNPNYL